LNNRANKKSAGIAGAFLLGDLLPKGGTLQLEKETLGAGPLPGAVLPQSPICSDYPVAGQDQRQGVVSHSGTHCLDAFGATAFGQLSIGDCLPIGDAAQLLPNPAGKGGAIQLVRQIKSLLFALEGCGPAPPKPGGQRGSHTAGKADQIPSVCP
jgi:hypothetical protein